MTKLDWTEVIPYALTAVASIVTGLGLWRYRQAQSNSVDADAIESLQRTVALLSNDSNVQRQKIDDLRERLSNAESRASTAEARAIMAEAEVVRLRTEIESHRAKISELESRTN